MAGAQLAPIGEEAMKQAQSVAVIGGGLAGCEAAWQLLKRGRVHAPLWGG